MPPLLSRKHRGRFRNGGAIVARFRSAEEHPLAVSHHRLAVSEHVAAPRHRWVSLRSDVNYRSPKDILDRLNRMLGLERSMESGSTFR